MKRYSGQSTEDGLLAKVLAGRYLPTFWMHTCPWLCEDFLTDGRGRPSYEMSSALSEWSINEILIEARDALQ